MTITNRIVSVLVSIIIFALNTALPSTDRHGTRIDEYNGGDPFIIEHGNSSYYTYTTNNSIVIRKTVSFDNTQTIEERCICKTGSNGIADNIWAPEIHRINNKWYIVACALFDKNAVARGTMPERKTSDEHSDYYRYGFVLESKTDDIFGEYEFKSILAPDGLNNIDGTYLQKDGKLYYVFSGYVDVAHQCIFIAEMDNPYTLKTDVNGKNNTIMVSRPEYRWEKHGWYVNEAPAILYKENKVFIVYSASGYNSGEYCMGMLMLRGSSIMNKNCWVKSCVKVFGKSKKQNQYHTGHCSFLYRDNGEIYMVYHATDNPDFSKSPRCTYIKRLS